MRHKWLTVKITAASPSSHPDQSAQGLRQWRSWAGTVVRVRRDPEYAADTFRRRGCDSARFYLVHPDDARRITGDTVPRHVCEHEITLDLRP